MFFEQFWRWLSDRLTDYVSVHVAATAAADGGADIRVGVRSARSGSSSELSAGPNHLHLNSMHSSLKVRVNQRLMLIRAVVLVMKAPWALIAVSPVVGAAERERYADKYVTRTLYLLTIGFLLTHRPRAVVCRESRQHSLSGSDWHRLTGRSRHRRATFCAAAFAIAFVSGCAEHTWCEYEPQVVALDERNEVVISTFPSALAQVRRHVPFLFKSYHSPPSVNLEFFVRATGTPAGRNPHIDSILVRSFSYAFPGQTPVRLIENYADGFWQQGQSQFQSDKLEPVGCFEGWYIHARFDLTLNGTSFTGEDTLFARERTRHYPLIHDALR